MTPEAHRILNILAKYKVSVPVGALLELGILDDGPCYLTLDEMTRIASVGGTVQWNTSGIVERIVRARNDAGFVAWGVHTVPHFIGPKPTYPCTHFPGHWLAPHGNPNLLPPSLRREAARGSKRGPVA